MELYTLDGLLRRTEIIEGYESFIWTERYSDIGELQIVAASTQQHRNLFANGTYIGLSESKRVMRIETIIDEEAVDGSKKLTITAKEIINVLNDRITATKLPGKPGNWYEFGTPVDLMKYLFDYNCRFGTTNVTDKIPLLVDGSLYAAGNLPHDPTSYEVERPIGQLYAAIKEIADVWDLGFRLYKGPDTGKLYFDVYRGSNRTSTQSILPAVIFSPDLDTLQGISEINSRAGAKNVAQVTNEVMSLMVYAEGATETTAGFDKRVLFVSDDSAKFGDVLTPEATAIVLAAMEQKGKEELAKSRSISAFDGEITQLSPYKYNRDYNMGDLVEMRNSDGLTNQMLITEQIFSADGNGESAYPTLMLKRFIMPGTWLAWENTQVWANAPGVWSTS